MPCGTFPNGDNVGYAVFKEVSKLRSFAHLLDVQSGPKTSSESLWKEPDKFGPRKPKGSLFCIIGALLQESIRFFINLLRLRVAIIEDTIYKPGIFLLCIGGAELFQVLTPLVVVFKEGKRARKNSTRKWVAPSVLSSLVLVFKPKNALCVHSCSRCALRRQKFLIIAQKKARTSCPR